MKTPEKTQEDNISTVVRSFQNQVYVNVFDYKSGRSGSYQMQHTHHSKQRSAQRGISDSAIALTMEYGMVTYKQGLEFYTLGKKILPGNLHKNKVENLVVVVSGNGNEIITCYKSKNGIRQVAKKHCVLSRR